MKLPHDIPVQIYRLKILQSRKSALALILLTEEKNDINIQVGWTYRTYKLQKYQTHTQT